MMSKFSMFQNAILCLVLLIFSIQALGQKDNLIISKETEAIRSNAYEKELADYLEIYIVDDYDQRADKAWHRDYSSLDNFKRSVEPNRQKWESMVIKSPVLSKTSPLKKKSYQLGKVRGEWLELSLVLAPDDLTFGERVYPGEKPFQSAPFYKKYPDWTIMARTLVDHMQALDLLSKLDRVATDRIGAICVSFGAYNSFFLSSVDPRIKAVVSICGMSPVTGDPNPYCWGIRDWYTHFPKITAELDSDRVPFDFIEIVALSAPVPMFFYAAQNDRIFPHWQSITEAFNDIYKLYDWLGYANNFQYSIGPGEHDFPPDIRNWAYNFLDRNLNVK
ncbi:MAG: hypothetical protein ABI325_12590 [Ginsengibacter sp.]